MGVGVGAEEALLVIVERVVGTALMLIVGSVLEVTFLLTVENVVGFALARSPLCTVTEPAARARGKRVTRVSAAVCILATGVEVVWSLVVVLSETTRSREGAVWFLSYASHCSAQRLRDIYSRHAIGGMPLHSRGRCRWPRLHCRRRQVRIVRTCVGRIGDVQSKGQVRCFGC